MAETITPGVVYSLPFEGNRDRRFRLVRFPGGKKIRSHSLCSAALCLYSARTYSDSTTVSGDRVKSRLLLWMIAFGNENVDVLDSETLRRYNAGELPRELENIRQYR